MSKKNSPPQGFTAWIDPSLSPQAEAHRWHLAHQHHQLPPSALYASYRLAVLWKNVAVHHSPHLTHPEVPALYHQAAQHLANITHLTPIHLIALGSGGSDKDIAILRALDPHRTPFTPLDVSPLLLIESHHKAHSLGASSSIPILANLSDPPSPHSWHTTLSTPPHTRRCITAFGILPNLPPPLLIQHVTTATRPGDLWLFSANLRPDDDPQLITILPQYDNSSTQTWILAAIAESNLHPHPQPHTLSFYAADSPYRWKAVVATYAHPQGQPWQVFSSLRPTSTEIQDWLRQHPWQLLHHWIHPPTNESLWLALRLPSAN